MTKVAAYDVINDKVVTLSNKAGGDADHDFTIQIGPGADLGIRSVLSFQFDVNDPSNLVYKFTITNGKGVKTDILSRFVSSHIQGMIQEVVDKNVLTAGDNKLTVTLTGGSGVLQLTDMVFWYFKTV